MQTAFCPVSLAFCSTVCAILCLMLTAVCCGCAVDVVKRIIPDQWRGMDYYRKLDMLVGVPVINIHIWCIIVCKSRCDPFLPRALTISSPAKPSIGAVPAHSVIGRLQGRSSLIPMITPSSDCLCSLMRDLVCTAAGSIGS